MTGQIIHWIPIEKEPTIENPWPRIGERILLWSRHGWPHTAVMYSTGWNIDGRPVEPRFLIHNYSHWAYAPAPEG